MAEDGLVEAVAGVFEELGCGVVIEDPALVRDYQDRTHPDEWGVPEQSHWGGLPLVKGYFPVDERVEGLLSRFKDGLAGFGIDPDARVRTREVEEEDWEKAWQAFYKPFRIGERLVVKPTWEKWQEQSGDLVVEMDPGLAFGCGTHETTAMCLVLLEKYLLPGQMVLDIGTGTGILAIAAAKLGAGRVVATDLDHRACQVARENVALNQVEDRVEVVVGNLLEQIQLLEQGEQVQQAKTQQQADLILANIIADVVIELLPDGWAALATGGMIILSGIIRERGEQVQRAMEAAGFIVKERCEKGAWIALVGERAGNE